MKSTPCNFIALPLLYLTLILVNAALPSGATAGTVLRVVVTDATGVPLENAVVSVHSDTVRAEPDETTSTIDQIGRQFLPAVVAIQKGSSVSFPNTDDVRHHVYSFSHPNSFEIKLYHGRSAEPVRFMHEGIVVLGCNIHDDMLAYIQVVDTPWFAVTGQRGDVSIEGVTSGTHILQVWHPDLGPAYHRESLRLGGQIIEHGVRLDISVPGMPERPEKAVSPLQALFRD